MGHLLCFPFYGPPSSDDEVRAGLGNHGEAPIVEWKKSNVEINTDGVAVRYYADLPKTQYRVERLVTLPRGLREVHVEEWVENLAGYDRPVNWMEHATFGPPFVEPGRRCWPIRRGSNNFSRCTIPIKRARPFSGFQAGE
jgi:hypothetical protein